MSTSSEPTLSTRITDLRRAVAKAERQYRKTFGETVPPLSATWLIEDYVRRRGGEHTSRDIAEALDLPLHSTRTLASALVRKGRLRRVRPGVYATVRNGRAASSKRALVERIAKLRRSLAEAERKARETDGTPPMRLSARWLIVDHVERLGGEHTTGEITRALGLGPAIGRAHVALLYAKGFLRRVRMGVYAAMPAATKGRPPARRGRVFPTRAEVAFDVFKALRSGAFTSEKAVAKAAGHSTTSVGKVLRALRDAGHVVYEGGCWRAKGRPRGRRAKASSAGLPPARRAGTRAREVRADGDRDRKGRARRAA